MTSIRNPLFAPASNTKFNNRFGGALAIALFGLSISLANAQATRTWVSGVGDDVNPCSRTAPCKTFAGAISKTAAGGEINVLDPGGFGTVTITKSITILAEGTVAGIASSGTNGINVNVTANDNVVLKGLDIDGYTTGLNGVRFIGGGTLVVDHCRINNFRDAANGNGIDFEPTVTGASLTVKDSVITNCTGTAIEVKPLSSGISTKATVEKTQMLHNGPGLRAQNGAKVTAHDSVAGENVFAGFSTRTGAEMYLDNCVADNNRFGVRADSSNTYLSGVVVTGNSESGLSVVGAASILSFGNNKIQGNTVDGTPTAPVAQQ